MFSQSTYSVPGVYRQPHVRTESFPRLRTDVLGMVGFAGPRFINEAVMVDDWRSYMEYFLKDESGNVITPPAGSRLTSTVRDFFVNGGARCWIVNVAENFDEDNAQALLNTMLGLDDYSNRSGLELLLRQPDVSILVLPELNADIDIFETIADETIPGSPCFQRCRDDLTGHFSNAPERSSTMPLYSDTDIMWAQRYLITRLQKQRWRWFALFATPRNKNHAQAIEWQRELVSNLGECDVAALYWPWVITQDKPGASIELRSPLGFVAGIYARRDLARGPHIAPANEALRGVVGLEQNLNDSIHGQVYDAGVNVIRNIPGRGIRVWGARTLLWTDTDSRFLPLAFVNARRCLSAIARTAERLGQQTVFDPNVPLLWLQLSQTLVGYLMRVFDSGALVGATPDKAFFVVCDATNNPVESINEGKLVCDVGVALAAPAEFIVFRVGRKDAVTEIEETA